MIKRGDFKLRLGSRFDMHRGLWIPELLGSQFNDLNLLILSPDWG